MIVGYFGNQAPAGRTTAVLLVAILAPVG